MVFSSLVFLFTFLPVFLIIYFLAPVRFRNFILFMGSLMFYAWGEPVYAWLMIFSITLDYSCGLLIHHNRSNHFLCRLGLILSLLGNLGLLCFFKYSNFFIASFNNVSGSSIRFLKLALPIGISFYTFQTMSYTIDLYRGRISVQKNIIDFAAYVTMFPQLVAGPIVTYASVEKELSARTVSFDDLGQGALRFIEGLGKKVLLANNIGLLWDTVHKTSFSELSAVTAWMGMIAFGLQLYFDFSGYSDMAIGLGKMLGFTFPENFNYPYTASSVTDFWRRWHITLGSWFREYVYIPLGGNRTGKLRFYSNIFVVWFLTGFWHGAGWNFIIWGLFFGIIMIAEREFLLNWLKDCPKFIAHFYLLFIVAISWVFFSHDSLGDAVRYLTIMFKRPDLPFYNTQTLYLLSNYLILLLSGILFCTPLVKKFVQSFPDWVSYIFYMSILVLSTAYLVDATFNPFLYFRF